MVKFTIQEEFDHHGAYHGEMAADWCKFCVPFTLRDKVINLPSLQRGEGQCDDGVMGGAFAAAELRASGPTTGGPQ